MQHDLLIENGTVIDGTGAAPFTADIAVQGGLITAIGRTPGELAGTARETIDAIWRVLEQGCTPEEQAQARANLDALNQPRQRPLDLKVRR